jgi:hypothetical protein
VFGLGISFALTIARELMEVTVRTGLLAGVAVWAMVQVPSLASAQTGEARRVTNRVDQQFMKEAAQGGMAEVELGKLCCKQRNELASERVRPADGDPPQ